MNISFFVLFSLFSLFSSSVVAVEAPPNPYAELDWHIGPKVENIGSKATLKTDQSLAFLDEENSKKYLKLTGNIPDAGNYILLSIKDNWWASFSFSSIGYVKDDEKIDSDALLQTLKDQDIASNAERRKMGLHELFTQGWYTLPHYDNTSKHLEWGVKILNNGKEELNYTIRLLGKTGVMNAILISSPETLNNDVQNFKAALSGFEFNSGESYAEFKEGDRVAEYGLAALIAGGAAAVATKKGFFAAIAGFLMASWKIAALAFVGLLTWIRSLFKSKS
jgi:uncharacterized membrane-anchored protein